VPDDPGVLRIRLGISDPAELARAEARLAAGREAILFRVRLDLGRYDLAHPHRHLFGQIYDWAGQLRPVNMSKATRSRVRRENSSSVALPTERVF
jgi:cell filamentation protein